ncbi:hypothetical protein PUW87_02530, partial [Metamycoplasma hyosynoviae]|uniref:hypothetical protein n=1 Tax=Metamycoplasma hyosynoviae TaxID=29559 RepID=UPI0023656CC3
GLKCGCENGKGFMISGIRKQFEWGVKNARWNGFVNVEVNFFKQRTAYEFHERLLGSRMSIRDSYT